MQTGGNMSDRTSGEPLSLLDYIGQQQPMAESLSDAVNVEPEALSQSPGNVDEIVNAEQVALDGQNADGQPTPVSTDTPDSEKILLQQRIRESEDREQKMLSALTLLAVESKKRETALFEQKLELLTPEEQEAEREAARVAAIEAENQHLRMQRTTIEARQAAAQEHVDKTAVAYNLVDRLGLPASDQIVMQTLMESDSFPEMVAKAQRIAAVYKETESIRARSLAMQANSSGVHAAGGETAPNIPAPSTPQRKGDLIEMMHERPYVAASI